jgi:GDP-L-fucose synthase
MFFKDKKVLVTGAAGFTGHNLVKRLLKEGANVVGTLHKKSPPECLNDDSRENKVGYYSVDLTKPEHCAKVVKGVDYVFMCSANTSGAAVMEHTPLAHVTPNVMMNSLMLEAAHKAGVKKFLFMSSTTVYPVVDHALSEDDVTDKFFEKYYCVGWMKRFSEVMCEMYSTKIKKPMTTIIVRPGNLYGEHDDYEWDTSHSTAALIRRVVERHDPLVVWGDGSDLKDLTYITDLVDGMVDAMEKLDEFTIVNIAAGQSYTIKETLQAILEADGYTDADVQYDLTKPVMIKSRLIDITKAKDLLNFNPKYDLKSGVKKAIKHYRETHE